MAIILPTKSIYFNDVNILPTTSSVKSRKEIPKRLDLIFISPMLSIVGPTFIKEAALCGLSVAIPRFLPVEKKIDLFHTFTNHRFDIRQKCFMTIGPQECEKNIKTLDNKTGAKDWLVDCANGYVYCYEDWCHRILKYAQSAKNLMVGNVVDWNGVCNLSKLCDHVDTLYIRVGIGNGSVCATSDVTGVNRGQITELMDCYEQVRFLKSNIKLVSDGGINKEGFCVKAFGAGANACFMGGYFSKAYEAEANVSGDGTYFGCASEKQNKLAGLDKHSEGKVNEIPKKELQSLKSLTDQLWGGISSGISYCGFSSVEDLIGNGTFEIKQNSLPPKKRN